LSEKRNKLARRLALWSIADQIDHESVDKEVALFSKDTAEDVKELAEIKEKMTELEAKEKEIIKNMITNCSGNIHRLQEKTPNSITKPLVDLAFWNRLSDLNQELYSVIHPHLSEMGDEEE
jgi:hypothetical protein